MLPKSGEYHERVQKEVDRIRKDAIRVSRSIHDRPELGLEERWACDFLTAEARKREFVVETPVAGLATGFIARYSGRKAGPRIAFLCEYDALPGLGHGCGHNIIAASSFGAAMALKPIVDELGGEILLVGTPDEEAVSEASKGGKVIMSRAGVFRGLDAAFMMHPTGGRDAVWRYCFPLKDFTVQFEGRPAHYTQPEKGINALESLLLFLSDVNALKRSWSPSVLLAYTITDGGGPSAIIVPKTAKAHITLKTFESGYMETLFGQIRTCVDAVSDMTGAKGSVTVLDEYRGMIPNLHLTASLYRSLRILGSEPESPLDSQRELERRRYPGTSTDFSDVSWEAPAIHGYCGLGGEDLVLHTPEFVAAAASDTGDEAVIRAAKAMALSAVDILTDKAFAARVKEEYQAYKDGGFSGVPGIPPGFDPFPKEFTDAING
jgi:amidohydrolase